MWITSNPARRARDPDRMARYPAPLPPALTWPVFSHAEAMTAGLSRDRLNRSDLQRLRRGLYARRDVNFKELDLAAALCRDDPELVVVGLSAARRSEEHTSELQSRGHLVCRLLLEKKKQVL